jgi:hypothetical protein
MGVEINGAVEGPIDRAVLRRLIEHVGGRPGVIHLGNGKSGVLGKLGGYNSAAYYSPWVVLVDLDDDFPCAPAARAAWLPRPAPHMCLRIAVREVEAWLLGDRLQMARFLGVPNSRLPSVPDAVSDPKSLIVEIARTSRRAAVREALVPSPGSGRVVGREYTSWMIEFAASREWWRPQEARATSPSLDRAIDCLDRLLAAVGTSDPPACRSPRPSLSS